MNFPINFVVLRLYIVNKLTCGSDRVVVISISLNEQNVKDLDSIQKDLGFSGRSEAVRTALRTLVAERNERKKMVGRVDGALIVVTEKGSSESIDEIYHKNQDMIKTHIHNHVGGDRCMNLLMMEGDANRVNKILDQLERLEGVSYLKFIHS
jgi:CopG family nickel-responsive transcriptional regulator